MINSALELPLGYTPDVSGHARPEHIEVLYHNLIGQWSELHHLLSIYISEDAKYAAAGQQSEYHGVMDHEGRTIGVSCLRYGVNEAELSCLGILPQHRSKGIGRWLIAERIKRAHELGLNRIHVEKLEQSNTLLPYYRELGFIANMGNKGRTGETIKAQFQLTLATNRANV